MQTLRKKTSPLKYKNETTRFLGDGVSFKAKLIGILEVSEARGDRMCQEALSDLKMAIRAAGEHKQRITINIAIDGLRLRDEKTGDSLYHHPVHKISFIAQDMTDSRAFGYIFGSPDTGHRFFGIKTDKAASQVVIAMRDLFQVVFALKKKEIELAKQHLDKNRFTSSPLFSDSSASNTKPVVQESTKSIITECKASSNPEAKSEGTAVADLVDLELELNSLQQGLNQMERITPSDPFGSKDDPFGDSFINYTKPILPPPPSSGRDRLSRSSETSSLFSPRTPRTAGSLDTNSEASLLNSREGKSKTDVLSHDVHNVQDSSTENWFSHPNGKNLFEEPPLVPEPTKDDKHELTKQEILSQFDVFTELDPLGTGKVKPYVDKKHFFQELKNPPKKVLNDLVSQAQQQETNLFNKNSGLMKSTQSNDFATDPFGEDPFGTEDPFAETDFTKNDPFETEFVGFKSAIPKLNHLNVENVPLSAKTMSVSPKDTTEKQMPVSSITSKTVHFDKQNTFTTQFDKFETSQENRLMRLHENQSFDMSSESECAPEPPPRPESTLMQIKPPPLPPKKVGMDFAMKPPRKPPVEESLYEYMDVYQTAPNSLELVKNFGKSPPIPVPSRKAKFDLECVAIPERAKKPFSVQSSDEDYLTPISFSDQKTEPKSVVKDASILLPPPRSGKKQNIAQVSVSPNLDLKTNVTTNISTDNSSLDELDITLSELTLSGLNQLAAKLKIPPNQLSNMTLVQLTNYLSNFVKSRTNQESFSSLETNSNRPMPTFDADFAANFNNLNSNATVTSSETYDRYAVFRELMNEEIKQTKIDTEPEELKEEKANLPSALDNNVNNIYTSIDSDALKDKYAALREIVETELKINETEPKNDNNIEIEEENALNESTTKDTDETAIINIENKLIGEEKEKPVSPKYNIIEYNASLDNKAVKANNESIKSPKSPVNKQQKGLVPIAITEIVQSNVRLNSGSLSDVVSGSSPEIDNTGSNSEVGKKVEDAAGESWAIFDQGIPLESVKEKQTVQSEEAASPWSSDSKEFGNGSPLEWQRGDSESGGDRWMQRRIRKEQDGWWDTSAEPEMEYYPSNRRSTDSYDDDNYECYERPRRRKQTGYAHGGQGAGGHSSSSRDVSPWEEEPRRETRTSWAKHAKQHSLEKYRDRKPVDSWDDEDDYEYEEERVPRFYLSDRQKWEIERERYEHNNREHNIDKWDDEWNEERKHRRRREGDRERWCCLDWDGDHDKSSRYASGRWPHSEGPPAMRRDHKQDERYYSRESQESPWDDDYSNEAEEISSSHYLTTKRVWKRPSSASEMDRKTGEIRSRHYLAAGGSDGERDRRYKPGRRSRSRDSQFSEVSYRHKADAGPPSRGPHRSKQYFKQFENDFDDIATKKQPDISKLDHPIKKCTTLASRKKAKESPKSEMNIVSTFPRKSSSRSKSLFENDFVPPEDESTNVHGQNRFNFENEFETSETESPTLATKSLKGLRQQSLFEKSQLGTEFNRDGYRKRMVKELKLAPRLQNKSKSLFEDDFSPSGKPEIVSQDNGISNIKQEIDIQPKEDTFSRNNLENATNFRKKKMNKHRLSNNVLSDINIKKSESVNIFARESDPFDDDFFSENVSSHEDIQESTENSSKPRDCKWTEDFEEFPVEENK